MEISQAVIHDALARLTHVCRESERQPAACVHDELHAIELMLIDAIEAEPNQTKAESRSITITTGDISVTVSIP